MNEKLEGSFDRARAALRDLEKELLDTPFTSVVERRDQMRIILLVARSSGLLATAIMMAEIESNIVDSRVDADHSRADLDDPSPSGPSWIESTEPLERVTEGLAARARVLHGRRVPLPSSRDIIAIGFPDTDWKRVNARVWLRDKGLGEFTKTDASGNVIFFGRTMKDVLKVAKGGGLAPPVILQSSPLVYGYTD